MPKFQAESTIRSPEGQSELARLKQSAVREQMLPNLKRAADSRNPGCSGK